MQYGKRNHVSGVEIKCKELRELRNRWKSGLSGRVYAFADLRSTGTRKPCEHHPELLGR